MEEIIYFQALEKAWLEEHVISLGWRAGIIVGINLLDCNILNT